ncbi:2-keto-4-pentenoate hydratase/2-oxohepta-3-ene-1,7-dioic acid hydratase in catechol pathway [Anoxybacillus vitaminiphilus]|uniref:2-keto-4-pentenoate hydratase/2-oxohepta-3-ene-1,7-dioic acid hydratase in catechol pathway n=1 Tax=Paranoxybacillus vitaminiphilus TaxID=581036 RepID=A0A327YES2_9BACL|nr:fumarylacetoacetate hydrolase family protein [Anoxybacillus vitaminiphilus]RAK19530.1 2-keto-4-pentenoate hydratase/2-oxohepta-3-ene-1,7-dioic acid hydratase in catechol pathway [Anoxybacillus vitaminiphilus]
MKFVTAEQNGNAFVGIADTERNVVIHLQAAERAMNGEVTLPSSLLECIALGDVFMEKASQIMQWTETYFSDEYIYPLSNIRLLAPIPRPAKNVFCVGKNYVEHALELGNDSDIPEHIMLFSKAPTTVVGHEAVVLNHQHVTNELDYEGELAVVIGKKGKGIKKEEAFEYVFGYTIINDITARDLQERHQQFLLGKSLDTSCPMGPWIVHKSLIPNPNRLQIETKVNGETRQKANTEQFIFNIETIISTISQGMTLEPGDIIATGTPAGVGKGMKPPRFLKPGDVVEVTIEGIGTLRNEIEK